MTSGRGNPAGNGDSAIVEGASAIVEELGATGGPAQVGANSEVAGSETPATAADAAVVDPGTAGPDTAGQDGGVAGAAPGDAPAGADDAGSEARLPAILESLLFVADRPLSARDLAAIVGEPDTAKIEGALVVLAAAWSGRGVQLHPVAGGWQLRSHPANAAWVQRLVAQKPVRLARSQLETLAIVSYRQPITRPEIDDIRGVDSGGTLKTLLERSLVRILGKKEEPGRPLLYGTTREFLEFFNLRDLRELPTLREFHELSDEHRAQVAALEGAAPPGSVEPAPPTIPSGMPLAPLERIELSDAPIEGDLDDIDRLIDEAGQRARTAAEALASELPAPPEREPKGPGSGRQGGAS